MVDDADTDDDTGATATGAGATVVEGVRKPRRARERTGALSAGEHVGRYVIQRSIARGGMGVVYEARDPDLGRLIAVKLVRVRGDGDARPRARERLQREAQALAQLSHPNVISIYDVGTHGDDVFIAMELVAGVSLRAWLEPGPRPWREIVRALLAAGRGLAAAHAAGMVHRDFKPDNVMIGDDGRVRVLDFGLARASTGELDSGDGTPRTGPFARAHLDELETIDSLATPTAPLRVGPESSRERLSAPLTQIGAVVGTPGYMSPEQHRGAGLDAPSDQYSFCVTLWEALYRQRPFVRAPLVELQRAKERAAIVAPPRDARVPAQVRRILRRGLAPDPRDRFPSMDALLAALVGALRARRRRLTIAAGVAAAAAVAALLMWRPAAAGARCTSAVDRLAGVWDPDVGAAVTRAFVATGRPHAAATARLASAALDRYAGAWTAMRLDSCEATHERGEQSEELLDLRTSCLDRNLDDVRALTGVFAKADADVVDRAVEAVLALPTLDACADAAGLRERVPLPPSPATRARVVELRRRLSDADALESTGKYGAGLALVERVVPEARAIGYAPLTAEALHVEGSLQDTTGAKAAADTLREAARTAALARDDRLVATSLIDLVWVVGNRDGHPAEGLAIAGVADAAIVRAGDPVGIRSALLSRRGLILSQVGRYDEAVASLREAIALKERAFGPDSATLGEALNNLGEVLRDMGKGEEARPIFERALAILEKALGPEHPNVSAVLNNLGTALWTEGKLDVARGYLDRSLAIDEATFGKDHPRVATSLINLGALLDASGHHDEARPLLERALAIQEKALGPDHPDVAMTMHNLASNAFERNDYPFALEHFHRALAIFEKALGPDHAHLAFPLIGIGDTLSAMRRPAEALASYQRALAIQDKALGTDDPDAAYSLTGMGRALLVLGRAPAAIAPLERAVALRTHHDVDPTDRARSQWVLALATWQTARDPVRAIALAREAGATLDARTDATDDDRVAAAKFLAAHAPPARGP